MSFISLANGTNPSLKLLALPLHPSILLCTAAIRHWFPIQHVYNCTQLPCFNPPCQYNIGPYLKEYGSMVTIWLVTLLQQYAFADSTYFLTLFSTKHNSIYYSNCINNFLLYRLEHPFLK